MGIQAVSYTHLDVYKRQIIDVGNYLPKTIKMWKYIFSRQQRLSGMLQKSTHFLEQRLYMETVSYTHLRPEFAEENKAICSVTDVTMLEEAAKMFAALLQEGARCV